jgi:SAM-dependent methyltransferase
MFSKDNRATFEYEGGDLEAMMLAARYYRWIRDTARPYIGENVVEVGAGVGSFSKLILETLPKSITLVEPSKTMHAKLATNIQTTTTTTVVTHNDYLRGLESVLRKNKPDTFVYVNVFEHIEDDEAELRRIAKLLKKGGHVIIFVPALQGLYSNFDKSIGHYRRYSKKTLRHLSEQAGLKVVKTRYMDMPGMLPWWFSFVLMKRTSLVPFLVNTYDNLCVPIIRLLEDLVEAPIGKNVLLIAQKVK